MMMQDLRYTLRSWAANPVFALVAILSLALGIGANTAIFSVWNGVLRASLPVVAQPHELVMLTDPGSSGEAIGMSSGDRPLMTWAEFEQLRDRAQGFAGLMASQSSLERWRVRIDGGGAVEDADGRMVSGGFFEVLGVRPAIGRAFTAAEDDRLDRRVVVISHDYWTRRFGGRPDAAGKTMTVRDAVFTIIGVMPPGFHGETAGLSPDFWLPLRTHPALFPGRDWLHDTSAEKVMWLHVFGRLAPGVSMAAAEASANAVFRAGLEAHYGSVLTPEKAREFLDQRLRVRPASSGASRVRGRIADPLNVLLAAVGVVLLIACANVANLLLARGAAREREMALRLSLGAGRGRLLRQMVTESLALAAAGGLLGVGVAVVLHRVLARLIAETDESFRLGFRPDPEVLLFAAGATLSAGLLCGLLPAWLAIWRTTESGEQWKGQGRQATGSGAQLRWGRILVGAQLALSLPLLMGAGLLVRTLSNLRAVDLGYPAGSVLLAQIDAHSAGYTDAARQLRLFEEAAASIRRAPGVSAVSYSENGLFSGRDSADEIDVEGFTPRGDSDRGSRWDQVGPLYFTTLGVPLLAGRDILDTDQAGSAKVCVVNESFAKRFFAGRNPLGRRITTTYGDTRRTHYVVGVARNTRTHRIKGDVPPRYFVPLTQPLGDLHRVVFEIRSSGAAGGGQTLAGIRQAVQRVDPALTVTQLGPVEARVERLLAQERVMVQLAGAFGLVALLLAAVGLYGVLSYNVTRRRAEIGIRVALGAAPGRVTAMILRETGWLVGGGLAVGAAFALGAARLMSSLLYGMAPHDLATLAASAALLVTIAALAAFLPARRAARLDPVASLRQE